MTSARTPGPTDAARQETVRAVVQRRYGTDAAAVLDVRPVAAPVPSVGEVVVAVEAVSLDMGTWHLMSGLPHPVRAMAGLRRPTRLNPVLAGTGIVVAVGDGVSGLAAGDAVIAVGDGMLAEQVSVRADRTARRPAAMTAQQAAGLPISASTALQAVGDAASVTGGQRVLVVGAAGGVGHYALQLAVARGAEVTAVCAPHATDVVRGLGAAHVLDYTRGEITDEGIQYDVIIDNGGNRSLRLLRRALRPKGRLVLVGGETGGRVLGGFDRQLRAAALSPFVGQSLIPLMAKDDAEHMTAVADAVDAGDLTTVIDSTFAMDDVASAMKRLMGGGLHGKVIITI